MGVLAHNPITIFYNGKFTDCISQCQVFEEFFLKILKLGDNKDDITQNINIIYFDLKL